MSTAPDAVSPVADDKRRIRPEVSTAETSPTAEAAFFADLAQRGVEPTLRKVSGRVRFDIVDGGDTEPWLVTVDRGTIGTARDEGAADCTIRGERAVFDELVAGRKNFMAAVLQGALTFRGDLELLVAIQRIFPDPPRGWDPTASTRGA